MLRVLKVTHAGNFVLASCLNMWEITLASFDILTIAAVANQSLVALSFSQKPTWRYNTNLSCNNCFDCSQIAPAWEIEHVLKVSFFPYDYHLCTLLIHLRTNYCLNSQCTSSSSVVLLLLLLLLLITAVFGFDENFSLFLASLNLFHSLFKRNSHLYCCYPLEIRQMRLCYLNAHARNDWSTFKQAPFCFVSIIFRFCFTISIQGFVAYQSRLQRVHLGICMV